jgi:hypothetical protein
VAGVELAITLRRTKLAVPVTRFDLATNADREYPRVEPLVGAVLLATFSYIVMGSIGSMGGIGRCAAGRCRPDMQRTLHKQQ